MRHTAISTLAAATAVFIYFLFASVTQAQHLPNAFGHRAPPAHRPPVPQVPSPALRPGPVRDNRPRNNIITHSSNAPVPPRRNSIQRSAPPPLSPTVASAQPLKPKPKPKPIVPAPAPAKTPPPTPPPSPSNPGFHQIHWYPKHTPAEGSHERLQAEELARAAGKRLGVPAGTEAQIAASVHTGGRPGDPKADPKAHLTIRYLEPDAKRYASSHVYPSSKDPTEVSGACGGACFLCLASLSEGLSLTIDLNHIASSHRIRLRGSKYSSRS